MTSVAYGIAMPASRGVLSPSNFCPQAQAFFARLATQPGAARKGLYNAMIASLVSAGVWSKLDALYMFAAADQTTALTNLSSASFGASAIGSPTFTADIGFIGASGKYVDSNFNPSAAAGKFQQDNASLFAWGSSVAAIAGETIGSLGAPRVELVPRYTDTNWYLSVNGSETNAGGQADGSGLRTLSRSSSTTVAAYKGGHLQFEYLAIFDRPAEREYLLSERPERLLRRRQRLLRRLRQQPDIFRRDRALQRVAQLPPGGRRNCLTASPIHRHTGNVHGSR
jgi:hypothetical protein